ncbi:MAG: PEGA domain-containing protein [Methanocalculus sp.]|uniref:PEGA domain-containing protein n=1 Tax=Methanocalculus sp. TaxID=2004547 RepID=UPI0027258D69|nr:PEGA domain-containing protein [Methanocalculus sp.]MDO9540186.1 PEGA domain-containing protein [Methanocalculus sp.]
MLRYLIITLGLLILIAPVSATVSISTPSYQEVTLGQSITFTGTAEHTTVVYLLMTGPGINPNGVSLTDIQAHGAMIRVLVEPDGTWAYTWFTQGISGKSGMTSGTYRIYASDTPLSANALPTCSGCAYSTVHVILTIPSVDTPTPASTGTLDLRSSVTGLSIYLDGTPRGTIPSIISGVPSGNRILELRSNSYYSWTQEVAVSDGTKIVTVNPTPIPKTGSISITSSPPDLVIFLNGANTGKSTPVVLTGIPLGMQIIDLKPAGYNTWTRTVTVYPGKTEILTANLVYPGAPETISPTMSPPPGETGSLHVSSTPVGSKVTVSGQLYGVTPLFIDTLTPGTYEVTISHDGYIPWSTSVLVDTAFTIELSPSLQPIPQSTPSPSPILTVIGALLLFPLFFRRR